MTTPQPQPRQRKPARANSAKAEAIIHNLIVFQGLSYVDAIETAKRWGDDAAAPYNEAATVIGAWLEDVETNERERGSLES